MFQAKHEFRDDGEGGGLQRKRQQPSEQEQVGSYFNLLQSSSSGTIKPSHQVPPNIWMVANSINNNNNNQSGSGHDPPVWTFPGGVNNNSASSAFYRGTVSSGLHFMNFQTPMALLPGQHQLGSLGGGGNMNNEGHLSNMLAAGLNPYRQQVIGGVSDHSQASGSQSHHGGGSNEDPHDDDHDIERED